MRKAFIALAVALLLIVPTVGALAATDSPSTAPQMASNATGEYTIDELREDGTHYSKPSARIAEGHVYWMTHQPAEQPWASEKQLVDRDTIKSDTLYLNSIRVEPEPKTFRLTAVFWDKETVDVTENNRTTTKQVARNVSALDLSVTLGKGWPTAELDLPHHQTPTQMTIWIQGLDEEARWTYTHHSIATTNSVPIDSEGDYLYRASTEFIFPTIIGAFVVGWLVKRALDAAGVGPMWGYAPWIVLISVVTGGILASMFGSFAEVFVHLPYIVAAYTVAIFGVILLETYEPRVVSATFIQPLPEAARSASGNHALDARKCRKRTEKVLKSTDDGIAVVRSGFFPFLARIWGKTAKIRGIENLDTEIEVVDDDENIFVVSPGDEQIIEYEPEGFEWGASAKMVVVAAAAAAIGLGYYHSPAMGAFGGVATVAVGAGIWLQATDGYARIEPAPAHLRSAWVSSMFLTKEADEAETLRESRKKRVQEMAKNEKHVEKELEERDKTLLQEMHDPRGVATVGSGGSGDADMEFDPELEDEARTNGHAKGGDDERES
jgi:hypothetical protein